MHIIAQSANAFIFFQKNIYDIIGIQSDGDEGVKGRKEQRASD